MKKRPAARKTSMGSTHSFKAMCDTCFDNPCNCMQNDTLKSVAVGAAFAVLFLVLTAVAAFVPSFYLYLGYVLFRGAIPVSVGDLSATAIVAGTVAWFLIGTVLGYLMHKCRQMCLL